MYTGADSGGVLLLLHTCSAKSCGGSSSFPGYCWSSIRLHNLATSVPGQEVLMDLWFIRLVFIVVVVVACWNLQPFELTGCKPIAAGILIGAFVWPFEM